MKLINQSAQYLPQQEGIDGIYKQVELAGRTSYLSYDKITENSAKKFVDMLIKSKHTSVLEHCAVYLKDSYDVSALGSWKNSLGEKYSRDPYSKVDTDDNMDFKGIYITTNLRVLYENGWMRDIGRLCEPTEYHEKRLSVRVITDIGVTREFNRHRAFSIVEQSTRYCNFSKDKFGNEITFIIPTWFKDILLEGHYDMTATSFKCNEQTIDINTNKTVRPYLYLLHCAEEMYLKSTSFGAYPQQARCMLPLATKSEVIYTAFESDWRQFFDQRLFGKTGEPHPDMLVLANLIKEEFEKAGVWEGIMKYQSKFE